VLDRVLDLSSKSPTPGAGGASAQFHRPPDPGGADSCLRPGMPGL